jgi:uncharacterized radical SAM superfamily Fe-S cluster-containing enzyme
MTSRLTKPSWPDPTPEMLNDPLFNSIWAVIKTWDVNVPSAYVGYCGATGNHVRAILDAVQHGVEEKIREATKCQQETMEAALELIARCDMNCAGCCGPSAKSEEYPDYLEQARQDVASAVRFRRENG